MMNSSPIRPTERSYYHPILKLLGDLGFTSVSEITEGSATNILDVFFTAGRNSFVLEVKIEQKDGTDPIITGIVQAYRYGLEHHTNNLIVISYPLSARADMLSLTELEERALKTRVDTLILTENWKTYDTKLTIEQIFGNLKARIDQNLNDVMRVETASNVIQRNVESLARFIGQCYKDDESITNAKNYLTTDYGFFIKPPTAKPSKHRERNQTIVLLAYILVNQILFYYLYSKKSVDFKQSRKVDELKSITYLAQLEDYFEQLRVIDYRPIFDILVAQLIPQNDQITRVVNELISSLTPLKISEMTHDMYGRLIGRYLPRETREILASYYTKTSSADLLANLTIDNYSNTVYDFACGSGTLLVSSYDRKMKLYQYERRTSFDKADQETLHTKFVEEEITGTDIMAFACHLTGLSLSAKNLSVPSNFLRVSVMNALLLDSVNTPYSIEEARGDISKELETARHPQHSMDRYIKPPKMPIAQSKTFCLEKVDRVVINPPFTSINKLPEKFRQSFVDSSISKMCGKRINLWGYFLALSDKILRDSGKIGAIIPISLLHGNDTLRLRLSYLKNYSIEYIIKPIVGKPFSEGCIFTDIIFVATKTKPDSNHKVRIVCLKEDITDFNTVEVETLGRNIKTDLSNTVENSKYFSFMVEQQQLLLDANNLMTYVFTNSGNLRRIAESVTKQLMDNQLFSKVSIAKLEDGYQLRPRGTANHNVITRIPNPEHSSRIRNALLFFAPANDLNGILKYFNKEKQLTEEIDKSQLIVTLRTLTGIDVLDSSKSTDYVMRRAFKTNPASKEKANLLILNRFWLKSTELFLTATYVEEPLCPLNIFIMYKTNKTEAKILSLYFNSIFYLIQVLKDAKQSTRGYLELKQLDLTQILIPDYSKIEQQQRIKLEKFFEENRNRRLESIGAQLSTITDYRLNLDSVIAECLGIKITKDELTRIYRLVWEHINNLP